DDNAGHVRIAGVAPGRALQDLERLAIIIDATARPVHQRDDTIDARIIVEQPGTLDLLGNEARNRRRAVYAADDADVIAGAGAAIAATEALERRAGLRRQQRLGLRVLAEGVIPLEGGKSAV